MVILAFAYQLNIRCAFAAMQWSVAPVAASRCQQEKAGR
jgi:hypothetical protein